MEDFVSQAFVETLTSRSTIGELRMKVDRCETVIEAWKKKSQALKKQCLDLNHVLRRFITDKNENITIGVVEPVKITRSVGLQVNAVSLFVFPTFLA